MVKGPVFRPIRDKPLVHYSPLSKGSKSGFLRKKDGCGEGKGRFLFYLPVQIGRDAYSREGYMFASKYFFKYIKRSM